MSQCLYSLQRDVHVRKGKNRREEPAKNKQKEREKQKEAVQKKKESRVGRVTRAYCGYKREAKLAHLIFPIFFFITSFVSWSLCLVSTFLSTASLFKVIGLLGSLAHPFPGEVPISPRRNIRRVRSGDRGCVTDGKRLRSLVHASSIQSSIIFFFFISCHAQVVITSAPETRFPV